jgi:flagellin
LNVTVAAASTVATIQDVIDSINGGTDFAAALGGANAATTVATGDDATAAFALTGGQATINVAAQASGAADGAEGNAVANLAVTFGNGSSSTSYNAATHTLTANLTQVSGTATLANLISVVSAGSDITLTAGGANTSATIATGDDGTAAFALNGGRDAGSNTFTVTADTAGTAANAKTVTLLETNSIPIDTAAASVDNSGNITVNIRGTVTKAGIVSAIDNLAGYSATSTAISGDTNYVQSTDTPPGVGTLAGGVAGSGGITQDAVFTLSGLTGAEVFNFKAGTSIDDLANAINLVKDATGVEASFSGTTLKLISSDFGSNAFVDVNLNDEAAGGSIRTGLAGITRNNGNDAVASVNGISAKASGNVISLNTATLDFKTTVETGFTGSIAFDVTGGGAQFQLGPEVVSNQQARIGITSVNTARLGGVDGKLFQLGSGGTADLSASPTIAAKIVEEAINQVTSLRGRLGAFQRTSLETNKNALNDTLVNLTDAQSSIRDTDFAQETANLTRAQILVQSGTTVLQIANSNPQNVLALLRNA